MEIRTLCLRCKSAYEGAGYKVYKISNQTIKGECDLCSRAGYDYYIKEEIQRGNTMCSHSWQKINDVFVCTKCGITRTFDGKIIFDRKIVNYKPKKRKNKKR